MKTLITTLTLLLFIFSITAQSRLDTTFGNQGKVITTLNQSDKIIALTEQSDGKIIALGQHHLVRYHANGNLDSTFANGGILDSLGYMAASVLVDKNNNIYVGGNSQGSATYTNGSATLTRYLQNGSVDTIYGQNGKITDSSYCVFSALAIQDNGKIVAGAHLRRSGFYGYKLSRIYRFQPDGSLDSNFISSASINFTGIIKQIKVLANGQLLGVGYGEGGYAGSLDGCFSSRFNQIGSIDSSYGSNGIAATQNLPFNSNFPNPGTILTEYGSMLIVDNGKVFFQTIRYDPMTYKVKTEFGSHTQQGQIDTIFNAFQFSSEDTPAMEAYSEKRLISAANSNGDFELTMLNEFAQIDTSCFSPLTIDFGGIEKVGAVLINQKGDILIAGESDTTFAIAKVVQTCLSKDDFVTTWKTYNNGVNLNDSSIFINTDNNYNYNYDVDWNNDGIFDTTGVQGNITHQYANPGNYTIRIKGSFPSIKFGGNRKIASVVQWGNQVWKSLDSAFRICTNFTSVGTDVPVLDSIKSLGSMFHRTFLRTAIDHWDVSNVTDMSEMFRGATVFNLPLNSWDVSNVTNMSGMFVGTAFNQPLNNWNVSSVTNMNGMFAFSTYNQPLSNWDVSSVSDMSTMFYFTRDFNQPLNNWDVSNVQDLSAMFWNATSFNQNLGNWQLDSVTDISNMLKNTGLSVTNYDSTLIGWQSKSHPDSLNLGADGLEFCLGETARDSLIIDGWIINGDSKDSSCVVTDINENTDKRSSTFKVYPNPSQGMFKIEVNGEGQNDELFIFDQIGQLVLRKQMNEGINQIELNNAAKGIYYIKYGSTSKKMLIN